MTCRWLAMPPQLATGSSTSKACWPRPTGAPWSGAAATGRPETAAELGREVAEMVLAAAARSFWQRGSPIRDRPPCGRG